MAHASSEEIKKHVKVYFAVFAALAFLTVVTVAVSYLHFPLAKAVLVALAVASVKGALVAAFFMHLSSEKKIIYALLLLTVFFFAVLLLIPVLS